MDVAIQKKIKFSISIHACMFHFHSPRKILRNEGHGRMEEKLALLKQSAEVSIVGLSLCEEKL